MRAHCRYRPGARWRRRRHAEGGARPPVHPLRSAPSRFAACGPSRAHALGRCPPHHPGGFDPPGTPHGDWAGFDDNDPRIFLWILLIHGRWLDYEAWSARLPRRLAVPAAAAGTGATGASVRAPPARRSSPAGFRHRLRKRCNAGDDRGPLPVARRDLLHADIDIDEERHDHRLGLVVKVKRAGACASPMPAGDSLAWAGWRPRRCWGATRSRPCSATWTQSPTTRRSSRTTASRPAVRRQHVEARSGRRHCPREIQRPSIGQPSRGPRPRRTSFRAPSR